MRTTALIAQSTWDNSRILYKFVCSTFCFVFFPLVSFVPNFKESEQFNNITQIHITSTLYRFLRKTISTAYYNKTI